MGPFVSRFFVMPLNGLIQEKRRAAHRAANGTR